MEPTEYKNPFASKTIWGLLITAVGLIGGLFGADVDKTELEGIVGDLSEGWPAIAQTIGLIMATYGRFKANQPIKMRPKGVATILLLVGLSCLLFVGHSARAEDPLFGPTNTLLGKTVVVEQDVSVSVDRTGWFVDGYTTGLFPTGANTPEPVDVSGVTAGGGAMIGYRFNDVIAVSVGGDVAKLDGAWMEHYMLDVKAYLPKEADPSVFMPDFVILPDLNTAQFYLLLGVGAQRYDTQWDTLIKGGLGVEMMITPKFEDAFYFIEGYYLLPGIATSSTFQPYVGARTGIRLRF